jgi:rod shape-determining protein MreC
MKIMILWKKKPKPFRGKDIGSFSKNPFSPELLKMILVALSIIMLLFLNIPLVSREVRGFFYLISSPIQNMLWQKGNETANFLKIIPGILTLEEQNNKLKLESQELQAKTAKLQDLEKEVAELRQALGLGLEKEFELKQAQVMAKEISKDILVINKGLKDGIKVNLPVITAQKVLVGKIIEAYDKSSKLQLSTSKESIFDVEIFNRDVYGLAKGRGSFQLSIDLIPREKDIAVGDSVMTSILGGNFPEGILVGNISNIRDAEITHFKVADIKPAIDFTDLETVLIVTNF